MKRLSWISLLLVAILSGCAANINVHGSTTLDMGNAQIETDKVPCALAGIKDRDYSQAQEFVFILPEIYLAQEWNFLRRSGDVVAIDPDSGDVFEGVFISELDEKTPDSHFYGYGKVFSPDRRGNLIILSTRSKMGFDAQGNGFLIDRNRLANEEDRAYKKELAKKGTPFYALPSADAFDKIIARWRYVYSTRKFGKIRTPLAEKQFTALCTANTGYNKDEADVRDLSGNINPFNPVSTLISAARDAKVKLDSNPETSGWDIDSRGLDREFSKKVIEEKRIHAAEKIY